MVYLCHVLVGEITALESQSAQNPGNISRTNFIFWDQEYLKSTKEIVPIQELMVGATHPFHCLYLVKCVREILSNALKLIQKNVPENGNSLESHIGRFWGYIFYINTKLFQKTKIQLRCNKKFYINYK
ncbi:hypothetical protein CDAR_605561 [Caerostris darwini]|uniref:Uncharacterized protein n=1 Tax=Caerostris darwini TaxID=1538125 RepID=A0AAV4TPI6_9ARAC|nr:hypothetical protein CDAR_605561 [Caerostris darwini]